MTNTVNRRHFYPIIILVVVAFFSLQRGLNRDLWFDEALTLFEFVQISTWTQIYQSYVIPNNQIVHTIVLKIFMPITNFFGNFSVALRLLPMICALGTLLLLYWGFAKRLGRWSLVLTMVGFILSPAFVIYGTALRGYMLSALLVTGALLFAMKLIHKIRFWQYLGYFLLSTLAVGTIPTNLLPLAALVIYIMPYFGKAFYKSKSFWLLALTPIVGFLIFYLPIWSRLMSCAKLGEGWSSGVEVLLAVYGLIMLSFSTLLVPMFFRNQGFFMLRHLIWLLPIPACFMLKVAPFPRTFFVLFPFWILLVAEGIKLKIERKTVILLFLFIAILGNVIVAPKVWSEFSNNSGGALADDFFSPYYMRPSFAPLELMATLNDEVPNFKERQKYLSFGADPWSFLLSGDRGITFDGPNRKISYLASGSIIILRKDEAIKPLEERFNVKLKLIKEFGRYKVYTI